MFPYNSPAADALQGFCPGPQMPFLTHPTVPSGFNYPDYQALYVQQSSAANIFPDKSPAPDFASQGYCPRTLMPVFTHQPYPYGFNYTKKQTLYAHQIPSLPMSPPADLSITNPGIMPNSYLSPPLGIPSESTSDASVDSSSPGPIRVNMGKNRSDTDYNVEKIDRRTFNNARERVRVRELNAAFKDLGKLCCGQNQEKKKMTNLEIHESAIRTIIELEKKIREKNMRRNQSETAEPKFSNIEEERI